MLVALTLAAGGRGRLAGRPRAPGRCRGADHGRPRARRARRDRSRRRRLVRRSRRRRHPLPGRRRRCWSRRSPCLVRDPGWSLRRSWQPSGSGLSRSASAASPTTTRSWRPARSWPSWPSPSSDGWRRSRRWCVSAALGSAFWWVAFAGQGLEDGLPHATLREFWLEGHGVGLLVAGVLLLIPAIGGAHVDTVRISTGMAGLVTTVALSLFALDDGLTRLHRRCPRRTRGLGPASHRIRGEWALIPRLPLVVRHPSRARRPPGASARPSTAWPRAGDPFTRSAGLQLPAADALAHPGLVIPAAIGLLATVGPAARRLPAGSRLALAPAVGLASVALAGVVTARARTRTALDPHRGPRADRPRPRRRRRTSGATVGSRRNGRGRGAGRRDGAGRCPGQRLADRRCPHWSSSLLAAGLLVTDRSAPQSPHARRRAAPHRPPVSCSGRPLRSSTSRWPTGSPHSWSARAARHRPAPTRARAPRRPGRPGRPPPRATRRPTAVRPGSPCTSPWPEHWSPPSALVHADRRAPRLARRSAPRRRHLGPARRSGGRGAGGLHPAECDRPPAGRPAPAPPRRLGIHRVRPDARPGPGHGPVAVVGPDPGPDHAAGDAARHRLSRAGPGRRPARLECTAGRRGAGRGPARPARARRRTSPRPRSGSRSVWPGPC